ncbi:UBC12 enzyme, partial [Atractosteus spatula]|nr:UBC12 enzyme [Atractosteus spatula]
MYGVLKLVEVFGDPLWAVDGGAVVNPGDSKPVGFFLAWATEMLIRSMRSVRDDSSDLLAPRLAVEENAPFLQGPLADQVFPPDSQASTVTRRRAQRSSSLIGSTVTLHHAQAMGSKACIDFTKYFLFLFNLFFFGFYKGGRFVFSFKVGQGYPHDPPKVKCETMVYHPNIDLEGNVCLNILREDWKPVLTVNSIIYGLQYLFLEPNPEDPLNKEAAEVLQTNRRLFEQNVQRSLRGGYVGATYFERCLKWQQNTDFSDRDASFRGDDDTKHAGPLNALLKLPQIQKIMMEFERQSELMDMKEEMMNDAIDDAMGDEDDEEESDAVVSQVLDELGLTLSDELSNLPATGGSLSVAAGKKAEPTPTLADADADLEERLNNLRRD